jgi:tetratricopeptide (TPR) repeat protein
MLNALGRRAEALAEVEEAVVRIPRLWVHGFLAAKDGPADVLDAAERGFRRAAAARPEDPEVLAGLATVVSRRGRLSEAAELWEQAGELESSAARWVQAAEARARLGDLPAAETAARRAIASEPARPEGYRALALSVLARDGRLAEAEEVLERGLRRTRAGGVVSLLDALSAVRRARGDVAGSLEALARAAELKPRDAHWQRRLAEAYLSAGDLHRAAIAVERAISLEPRSAPLYELKGRILEARYDLQGAREAFQRAAQLDPTNPSVAKSLERIEGAFASGG